MMIIFFVIQSWVYDPYTSTKHRKNKKNILTDSQIQMDDIMININKYIYIYTYIYIYPNNHGESTW